MNKSNHQTSIILSTCAMFVLLMLSASAEVRFWIGTGGGEDWSAASNWKEGKVADGDDDVLFAPPTSGAYNFVHHVIPPASFKGTILTSNELAFTTSWWTLNGPVEVAPGIVDGATWKIGGNGTFVACDGFESHVPSSFTGKLVIPKGITFTAPDDLNENVLLTGGGSLILSSASQLSQARHFTGEVTLPGGSISLSDLGDFSSHNVKFANGQTVSLSGHDSAFASVDVIESFADAPEKWSFNGSISTTDDGTKKPDGSAFPEGAYNKLPPYVKDGVLYLTDDPSQCHTAWYTNRYFRAGDEIGLKFTWVPALPRNPHVEGAGRSSVRAGVFSVCLQGESPVNCSTGLTMDEMRLNHSDGTFGFLIYTYRGDGHPYIGWSAEKQYATGSDGGVDESVLSISLEKAIDFSMTFDRSGQMTVTLEQDGASETFTKSYKDQVFERTAKGFYIGFTGASDTWGYDRIAMPWVSHRVSNFRGWCRSEFGGNWQDVANGSDFVLNAENWHSIQGAGDGSCVTNASAAFEPDGSVKLVTAPATMTMLASQAKVDRTKPTKIMIDIAGGTNLSGQQDNLGKVGVVFGLLQENTTTFRPKWNAAGYYELESGTGIWMDGMWYRWNMTDKKGRYHYSGWNNDPNRDGEEKSGMNAASSTANQDVHVEMVLDPTYGFRSRLSRSPSTYGNGSVKTHEWGIGETCLADWTNTNHYTYLGQLYLRATAGTKDCSQMTLTRFKVQQIEEPSAGFLAGEMIVPDGASVIFKAGEAKSSQDVAFVNATGISLGDGATLSVLPETAATSVAFDTVTVGGEGSLQASSGASVSIGDIVLAGDFGATSLAVMGDVSLATATKVTVPDVWIKGKGRQVLVDMRDSTGESPVDVRIVTGSGVDVTERAQVTVAGGKITACFERGFMLILR